MALMRRLQIVCAGCTPKYTLSAGFIQNCVIDSVGHAHCWGKDTLSYGTQASPDGPKDTVPAFDPPKITSVNQVASGGGHSCAVTTNGGVICWGNNNKYNQTTVPPSLETSVVQVAAGVFHSCALKIGGAVSCWGNNGFHQLDVPQGLGPVMQISCGALFSCALANGVVKCWGDYPGLPTPSLQGQVVQISSHSSGHHMCALTSDGGVTCWERGSSYAEAVVPHGLGAVQQVSAGRYHTCVLLAGTAGAVRCWGSNSYGQSAVPSELGPVAQLAAGGWWSTCAILVNGMKIRCWGGDKNTDQTVPPFAIPQVTAATPYLGKLLYL